MIMNALVSDVSVRVLSRSSSNVNDACMYEFAGRRNFGAL